MNVGIVVMFPVFTAMLMKNSKWSKLTLSLYLHWLWFNSVFPTLHENIDALTDDITLIKTSMRTQEGCRRNLHLIRCNGKVLTAIIDLWALKYIIIGFCCVWTIIAFQNSCPQNHTSSRCHKDGRCAYDHGSRVCLCTASRAPAAHQVELMPSFRDGVAHTIL